MPTITQVSADLETKKKSLTKTEGTLKTLDQDFKKIATEQQKAESQAKSEKDPNKKKVAQDKADKLRDQGDELLKKKAVLEKSLQEFEKNVATLTEQLETMKKGQAAFGKKRTDYLEWFKGAKQELDREIADCKKYMQAAEQHRNMAEKLLTNGSTVKAAEEAGAAGKMAEFARAGAQKVDSLVTTWGSKQWAEQRNLAPSEFGIDGADVKVHDDITKKVYATFTIGDRGRDEANLYAEKAETAAEEAEMILNAGDNAQKKYEMMLAKSKELITKKVQEYDNIFGTTWGRIAIDEGARFNQEASMIKPGEQATIARALKVAEQARAAVPKQMVNAGEVIKQAGELAKKERARIPESMQRAFKTQLDELANIVIALVRKHKEYDVKFKKTMVALTTLEKAAGKK